MKVDSKLWDQFTGLAKFLDKSRDELLEEAIKIRMAREKKGGTSKD